MLARLWKWLFGPSAAELYREQLAVAQEQSTTLQHHLLQSMREMTEASKAQSNVLAEYLKIVTSHPEPVVRVMTDRDEAIQEEVRNLKSKYAPEMQQLQEGMLDPGRMQELFGDYAGV